MFKNKCTILMERVNAREQLSATQGNTGKQGNGVISQVLSIHPSHFKNKDNKSTL